MKVFDTRRVEKLRISDNYYVNSYHRATYNILLLLTFSCLPNVTIVTASRTAAFQSVRRRVYVDHATRQQNSGRRHAEAVSFPRKATAHFSSTDSGITLEDVKFMDFAVSHARRGWGHTFPNPAVGCVLVQTDTNKIIGSGFHPRAGMPHAEIFALMEACGHVESGVAAASSVLPNAKDPHPALVDTVHDLSRQYSHPDGDGPQELFGSKFDKVPVTAYVTLEPCCHVGKTPPCAASLVAANVDRVVVGFRDPNPRVDGGGVQLLEEAGITVDLFAEAEEHEDVVQRCAELVECFVKRITPQERAKGDYSYINGKKRRALRSLSAKRKADATLAEVNWPTYGPSVSSADVVANIEEAVDELSLDPTWMEAVDSKLWSEELVLLRLSNAVAKKKGAKRLGERIAIELDAHIVQVLGHTILLYRPGLPPKLDLNELVKEQ